MTRAKLHPRRPGTKSRPLMNIVVIGHVDHGKSTVIGRLLADTGSLPEGRLEMVRQQCRRNSKPFEYAFLLDALKDEQAQGITIDSARCFFGSAKREYIIIDAPGHIEFLKNMISGAARAEAGLLIIDAKEGVQENSRRHGYLMGMLGIRQLAVCVNKMDLVGYDQGTFESIRQEYGQFLRHIGIVPRAFIPISAREGDCIVLPSEKMPWHAGPSVLEALDGFQKDPPRTDLPLRMPVQDVYKFTARGDDRRIVAGRIETGVLETGDEVVFLPSGKRSRVASIEGFHQAPRRAVGAGQSTGLTLQTQLYVQRGELMCKASERPARVGKQMRANLFWLGRQPMVPDKRYGLKLAGARSSVWLREVLTVLDASDLASDANKKQIDRHDVAECILETVRPVAADPAGEIPQTGRFVIVDNYDIAGGGIVLEVLAGGASRLDEHVRRRREALEFSAITPGMRGGQFNQRPALVLITGPVGAEKQELARALEKCLFHNGRLVYYIGLSDSLLGFGDAKDVAQRDEFLIRLGEVSHLFTDAGLILIATVSDLDDFDLDVIDTLNRPNELVLVNVGENRLTHRRPDMVLEKVDAHSLRRICELLESRRYLVEYHL